MENSKKAEVQACACSENLNKANASMPKSSQVIFTPDLHKNILSLKLKDKEIQDFVLSSILLRVSSVKTLELINVELVTTDQNKQSKIFLKELESVLIENSTFELLSFLLPTNLKHFRIVSKNLRHHEALKNFLLQCNSLIKLEIHAIDCDIMNFFTPTDYPFHLKRLSLSSTLNTMAESYDNEIDGLNFLIDHCNTVHTLAIHTPLPLIMLEFMLKKFRLLRTLVLRSCLIPLNGNFYPQKYPKKSVKVLTLEGPYMNVKQCEGIFKLYPVIQCFHLDNIFADIAPETVTGILKAVSIHCTTLFELSIPRLPWLTADVKFKTLSVLKLKYINHIAEIKSILKNSPNLRKFQIEHIFRGQCSAELIDTILSFDLCSVHIGADPYESMAIYNLIEKHPTRKLDMLELFVQTLNYAKTYLFRFNTVHGNESNYASLAYEMNEELKDYTMREMLKLVEEQNGETDDDDAAIVNFVMNSFEFI